MKIILDFFTIFNLIKLSLINNSISDNDLYKLLICLNVQNYDEPNNPHRHIIGESQICKSDNGKAFLKTKLNTIVSVYDTFFTNEISVESKKKLTTAFKRLFSLSTSIMSNEVICGESGITKETIINDSIFCFPVLVASIMKYVVARDNRHRYDHKEYKPVVENFFTDVPIDNISFTPTEASLPFDRDTSKIDKLNFKRLFKEVKTSKLPTEFKNYNDVKVYILNIKNSLFDLNGLSNFIEDNIEHYVMSSLEEKSYYDERRKHLTHDAIKKFVLSTKDQERLDIYSKLMLYIFMECGLGAPKLFNAIEIKDKDIKSDGVYYLRKGIISDKPMLVLGASKAYTTLEDAIDSSLTQAEFISNNQDDLLNFINPSFLKLRFDQDDLIFIADKLMKAQGLVQNDAAFGIFLSYSLNEVNDGSLKPYEFADKIIKKAEQNITSAITTIYEKIKAHNLSNYSFFIFVLPLTEVNGDVDKIINGFLGGDTNA